MTNVPMTDAPGISNSQTLRLQEGRDLEPRPALPRCTEPPTPALGPCPRRPPKRVWGGVGRDMGAAP